MDHVHPLGVLLDRAARGHFPPPDGIVEVIASPPGPTQGVLAFTAHHVVAADVEPQAVLEHLDRDDLGSPMKAPFLAWLGEELGSPPGMLDVVLVAPEERADDPSAALSLDSRDPSGHPRIERAVRYRENVRAFSDAGERGVLIVGQGLAGRWEVSLEVDESHRGAGLGRRLAAAARALVPQGEPLFAQVSPGNVSSLRAFLAAGYRPIGAEVLFLQS
jgi:GNAT superfamily N-acetyltransferase